MQEYTLHTPTRNTAIKVAPGLSASLSSLEQDPVLLIDEHVLCQHNDVFGAYRSISIPSGERYKTLETVEMLYRELVKLEVDRSTLLVGVGGGLATDVAGFVASTFLRELPFGFISSTLLGQVDASIGGKNGVNLDGYKNMIGTIRQPAFVWCDLDLLKTLTRKEYHSGLAEVIKYGAIMDAEFLMQLDGSMQGLLEQNPAVLEEVVGKSIACKVEVVESDEHELGKRRLLNFGHTFGHAIERDQKVLHGYAVAVGMAMAAELSVNLGSLQASEAAFLKSLITMAGLPVEMNLDPETIYQNLKRDKKKEGKHMNFILLEGLGHAVVRPIPVKDLKSLLHDLC